MMMMLQNSPNYSIQLFPKAHPQSFVITPEQMLLSKQFRKLMMLESLHSWLTGEINKEGLCVSQIVANNDQGAQAEQKH